MIEVAAAIAGATKAYAGVKAFIEAGKSIEETFTVVARWQGIAQTSCFIAKGKKAHQPTKKLVFSQSVEAEAASLFAHRKRLESQRKELLSMLNMAYGKEGVEEYRRCMKEVAEQRRQEVYAQQEAKDAFIKSFWIGVLVLIAGGIIAFIVSAVASRSV